LARSDTGGLHATRAGRLTRDQREAAGADLRTLRQAAGLRQTDVAAHFGVRKQAVFQWESGAASAPEGVDVWLREAALHPLPDAPRPRWPADVVAERARARKEAIEQCRAACRGARCACGSGASWGRYVSGTSGGEPTVWAGCGNPGHDGRALGQAVSADVFRRAIVCTRKLANIAAMLDDE
jgi:hypothetical protein